MRTDVDYRKQYVQQMARVQNTAARCRWSRGKQTVESLRNALTRAEEALAALKICGGPDPEDHASARERSGLDGWATARQVHALAAAGYQAEADRLAVLGLPLDLEHQGIATAISRFKSDSTLATEQLSAIVDDCSRSARARLHAAWWLATIAHVKVGHGRLLDMLDAAMSVQDWLGAELAMRAIRSHMEHRRLSVESHAADFVPEMWPMERQTPPDDLYDPPGTWRTAYGPDSAPTADSWDFGH